MLEFQYMDSSSKPLFVQLTALPAPQLRQVMQQYGLPAHCLPSDVSAAEHAAALCRHAQQHEAEQTLRIIVHQVRRAARIQKHDLKESNPRSGRFSGPRRGSNSFGRRILGAWPALMVAAGVMLLIGGIVLFRLTDLSRPLSAVEHLLDSGDYAAAEALYAALQPRAPRHRQIRTGLHKARILRRATMEQLDARQVYDLLAALPEDAHTLVGLADAHARRGELEIAADYYHRAQKYKKTAAGHFGLSSVLLGQGQWQAAQVHLRHALTQAPEDRRYLAGLDYLHLLQGKYTEARLQCERNLVLDPDFLLFHYDTALLYWWQGDVEQALARLSQLERLLARSDLTALPQNRIAWRFPGIHGETAIYLDTWAEKQALIFTGLAAGWFLLGEDAVAQAYFERAWQTAGKAQNRIRSLLARDIGRAVAADSRWRARAAALYGLYGIGQTSLRQ